MKKYNIFWVSLGVLLFQAVNVYADKVIEETESDVSISSEEAKYVETETNGIDYQIILENFKNNEKKYEYSDIAWKDSFDEVKKKFGDKVIECNEMNSSFLDNEYRYLKHIELHELDGQKVEMYFEFVNDELQAVRYDFLLEREYTTWFQKQIEALIDLYGDDYILKEMENEEFALQDTFYKWEYADSSICAFLITGETVEPVATIGITMLD